MSTQLHSRRLIPCNQPAFNASDLMAALFPAGGRSEFEAALAARVGARFCLTFPYGRLALLTTLKALGFKDSEIILPAFTCPTMAEAVVASGNRPVFVDINLADYTMDLTALTRALNGRTRAIVVTHLYGYYSDVQKVREVVKDGRITILEDCAQRVPAGTSSTAEFLSDVAIFSLGLLKPVCAIRGGVAATNSAELYERIKNQRDQRAERLSTRDGARLWVWLLASYFVYRRSLYGLWQSQRAAVPRRIDVAFGQSDHQLHADNNTTLANFQARIASNQLARLDAMLAHRCELAAAYDRELRSIPEVCPAPLREDATYTFYTIRVPGRDERAFEQRMKANGVMVGRTFDFILPGLKPYLAPANGSYPAARQAASQVINLPIHPDLSDADVSHIVECIRRSLLPARAAM